MRKILIVGDTLAEARHYITFQIARWLNISDYQVLDLATFDSSTDAQLIISMGELCLRHFLGKKSIMNWRGYGLQKNDTLIQFTLSPKYVRKGNPEYLHVMIADFQKGLKALEKGGYDDESFETKINPDPHLLNLLLQQWSDGFTFDIETGPWEVALNPRLGDIKSIALCGRSDLSISVEWKEPYISIITPYLKEGKTTAQNAPFDIGFLQTKGYFVERLVFDTALGLHTICSDLPKSLNFQRTIYTNIPPYKSRERGKPRDVTQLQGCLDALVTYRSWKAQEKQLKEDNLEDFYYNFYLPKINLITKLNARGVHVDKNLLVQKSVPYGKKIKTLETYFDGLGLNPNSPKQVGNYIVKKMKIPLHATTKTGQWKVDEENLNKTLKTCYNAEQRDFIQKLLDWNATSHEYNTYVKGVYQRLEGNPPKIYTNYNIARSLQDERKSAPATGRLASENPNLQNVPVPLRCIYVPPPGYVFIGIDYSQLELTLIALLAGEESLLDLLRSGVDPIDEISVEMYNLPKGAATHDQRIITKQIVYGTAYGASAYSLARRPELPYPVVTIKTWQDRLIFKYPKIVEWRDKIKEEAQTNGYLTNIYGRRRYFFEDKVTTKAYNFPVQSAASDLVLDMLAKLDDLGHQVNLPVHDFGAVECLESSAEVVSSELKSIISEPNPKFNGWSFRTKIKIGKNWEEVS